MICESCKDTGYFEFTRHYGNKKLKHGELYQIACPKCKEGKLFRGRQGSTNKIREINDLVPPPAYKVNLLVASYWDWPKTEPAFEKALDSGRLFMKIGDWFYRVSRVKPTKEGFPWVCYVTTGFSGGKPITRSWLKPGLFRIEGTELVVPKANPLHATISKEEKGVVRKGRDFVLVETDDD